MKIKIITVSAELAETAKRFVFEDRDIPVALQVDETLPAGSVLFSIAERP